MRNRLLEKRWLIIIAAAILVVAFIVGIHLDGRKPTIATLLSRSDYQMILSSRSEVTPSERRGHLCVDGAQAPFADGSYLISADPATDFLPRLTWSNPDYTISLLSDEIADAPRDSMAANQTFTILVTNGTEYFVRDAIFTSLPVLCLTADQALAYKTGVNDGSAMFRLFSCENSAIERICSYRLRGGSSLRHPKKPYRVTLYSGRHKKESVSLLSMRESEDWILLPLYTDTSRMREKLAMELWNAVANTNPAHDLAGSAMEYTELVIDGVYQGVYGLVTPLDAEQCGIRGDMNARLFKVIEYMWQYVEDNYYKNPKSLSEIVELKYPAGGDWSKMYQYVDAAILTGASDASTLNRLMDQENLIDYMLFANFVSANDNIFKNIYFVWRLGADGVYRFTKIPWDFNYTFGDTHADNDLRTKFDKILAQRDLSIRDISIESASDDGTMDALFAKRYAELRNNVFSYDELIAQLEDSKAQLTESGAFVRESKRWPESMPNLDLADLSLFIKTRIQYFDEKYGYVENEVTPE